MPKASKPPIGGLSTKHLASSSSSALTTSLASLGASTHFTYGEHPDGALHTQFYHSTLSTDPGPVYNPYWSRNTNWHVHIPEVNLTQHLAAYISNTPHVNWNPLTLKDANQADFDYIFEIAKKTVRTAHKRKREFEDEANKYAKAFQQKKKKREEQMEQKIAAKKKEKHKLLLLFQEALNETPASGEGEESAESDLGGDSYDNSGDVQTPSSALPLVPNARDLPVKQPHMQVSHAPPPQAHHHHISPPMMHHQGPPHGAPPMPHHQGPHHAPHPYHMGSPAGSAGPPQMVHHQYPGPPPHMMGRSPADDHGPSPSSAGGAMHPHHMHSPLSRASMERGDHYSSGQYGGPRGVMDDAPHRPGIPHHAPTGLTIQTQGHGMARGSGWQPGSAGGGSGGDGQRRQPMTPQTPRPPQTQPRYMQERHGAPSYGPPPSAGAPGGRMRNVPRPPPSRGAGGPVGGGGPMHGGRHPISPPPGPPPRLGSDSGRGSPRHLAPPNIGGPPPGYVGGGPGSAGGRRGSNPMSPRGGPQGGGRRGFWHPDEGR